MKRVLFVIFASLLILSIMGVTRAVELEIVSEKLHSINIEYKEMIKKLQKENKKMEKEISDKEEQLDQIYKDKEETIKELRKEKENLNNMLNQRSEFYREIVINNSLDWDLTKETGYTKEQEIMMLDQYFDIFSSRVLQDMGRVYVEAGRKHGINPVFLASVSIHETGHGRSKLASRNNLFGWRAFDRNPVKYASTFASREEGIYYVVERINNLYIEEEGNLYVSPTPRGIGSNYASDREWAVKVVSIMADIIERYEGEEENNVRFLKGNGGVN